MTSSIPDGISFSDLQQFARQAQPEPEVQTELDLSLENLQKVARIHLSNATDDINDPLVHKIMMLEIAANMVRWHVTMAEDQAKNGNVESAACWMRDGGKFQAIMDVLMNISFGDDDPALITRA